jgi:phosphomannomutase
MPKSPIKFGTDGWRGVIAADFTFDNVRRVAQATADYWNEVGQASRLSSSGTATSGTLVPRRTAIIGYDNRFQSETFARVTAEVLAANGIETLYAPTAAPTPSVSHAVRDRQLVGAVMITASHNPPQFNGYKLKAEYAGSADPAVCHAIEQRVDRSPVRTVNFDEAVRDGRIVIYDPRPAHVAAVKRLVDLKRIRNSRLGIVVDSMHGSGGDLLATLLGGGKCRVHAIRANRDVLFGGINPEPIGQNLGALGAAVKECRAAVGLATDGDADRLGVVDEQGRYVSIQLVFAMLLLHILRNREHLTAWEPSWRRDRRLSGHCTGHGIQAAPAINATNLGLVVRSTNGTMLIDRICRAHGLAMAEVPVGFKWICEKMRETDVLLGGEESGGIGFHGHIPERDGILACLMFLEMLAATGQRISAIAANLQREFGRSVYHRVDIQYPLEKRSLLIETLRREPPPDLLGVPLAGVNESDGVKYIAGDDSWLMFRTSGTEPIVRIYSEAASAARVRKLLAHGQQLARRIAGGTP